MPDVQTPARSGGLRAIILAAGKGSRLFPLTRAAAKPMTEIGGSSIIAQLLAQLEEIAVDEVVIVTGHAAEPLAAHVEDHKGGLAVSYVHNSDYATSNNIYSLWCARAYFDRDFLLLEADIICPTEALRDLAARAGSAALISPKRYFMDGACVQMRGYPPQITAPRQPAPGDIVENLYKTVNFYRIDARFAQGWMLDRLEDNVRHDTLDGYYETVFAHAIDAGAETFEAVLVAPEAWYEVDNTNDLDLARFIRHDPDAQLAHLQNRHGGYWRYPAQDHCLLYNFHYPPAKFLTHIRDRLEFLLREYPSSQAEMAALAGILYEMPPERLAVVNGVSELIPHLFAGSQDPVLIPTPSFNEYEAAAGEGRIVRHALTPDNDFDIDPEALVNAAKAAGAGHVVLVSPNNPTGRAIPPAHVELILTALAPLGIEVILDESFIDFAPRGRDDSFLTRLDGFSNLTVVLSLSKSHGLGGVRLGVLASADTDRVARIRAGLPIWNINAFAEEYLRMAPALQGAHSKACAQVRAETDALQAALDALPGLSALPSDANFVMCRVAPGHGNSAALTRALFHDHRIFIKDCAGKTMPDASQYVRIASRGRADDARLVAALQQVLAGSG